MISNITNIDCSACGACISRCPKHCISFLQDKEGFLYPRVDTTECINCGVCDKVCQINNPYEPRTPSLVFAAINNDEEIRLKSSSGGFFSLLSEYIIEKENGVVFGARYDNDWQVVLDYTESIDGLALFRGSKYVQARIEKAFIDCELFLKKNRKVLFSGTPCQISGLKHFLRREYTNLVTVDFACHGVPSPKVWGKYIESLKKNVHKDITENKSASRSQEDFPVIVGINFRDKRVGWKKFCFTLALNEASADGKIKPFSHSNIHYENTYMRAFLSEMILRPSCYHCKVRNFKSHSDITIADYWGIQWISSEMDDDKGTSLVIIHNVDLLDVFRKLNQKYKETKYNDALRFNQALISDPKPWYKRAEFFKELDETGDIVLLINEKLKPTLCMLLNKQAKRYNLMLRRCVGRILKKFGIKVK